MSVPPFSIMCGRLEEATAPSLYSEAMQTSSSSLFGSKCTSKQSEVSFFEGCLFLWSPVVVFVLLYSEVIVFDYVCLKEVLLIVLLLA